jgi:predicted dehydrogenase
MSPAQAPVRLGVLGAGAIAQVAHLPILTRMRGVEVGALFDTDRSKARTIAERFGVGRVHGSVDELWRDPDIDGVIVCTPSHLHEEQVRAGLEAGKYVLCEKPLALSAEGGRRVLETPGAAERLMVGMNQRFRPDAAALRSFVLGGELGDVFYLRAGWLNRRTVRGRAGWRQRKAGAGGGVLMDLGVQMLDLSLWLLGYPEPERVTTHVHRTGGGEVEDSAVLILQLGGNRVINLEVTWALISERERQYLHVLGSQGSGSLSPLKVYKDLDGTLGDVTPQIAPGRENQYTASYRQQLLHFTEVVRGGDSLEAPAEQLTLLRVVEAAYRSAETGREVHL